MCQRRSVGKESRLEGKGVGSREKGGGKAVEKRRRQRSKRGETADWLRQRQLKARDEFVCSAEKMKRNGEKQDEWLASSVWFSSTC